MYNKITLVGRLTKDVDVRQVGAKNTTNGKFTIAVNRKFDREKVDFIPCEAWGKTAENINKFFQKGSVILVDGELHIDSSDGKYFTKVNVETFSFVGSKNETQQANTQETQQVETNDFTETKADFSSTDDDFFETSKELVDSSDLPF